MDLITPIMFALGVFAFQFISNYIKEKERAMLREQQQAESAAAATSKARKGTDPDVIHPTTGENRPFNPYEQYEGAIVVHEGPKRRRVSDTGIAQRSDALLTEKLAITDLEQDSAAPRTSISGLTDEGIDLRQAMIHSIILERRYQSF